jgi:hypothetical protein
MKNNFKFKVWDKQKHVFIPDDVYAIFNENIFGAFGMMIKDWEDYREGKFFYDNAQEIIYSTGFLDKNGSEIYEKYILSGGYVVRFYEGAFGFWAKENSIPEFFMLYRYLGSKEIIGNLFENPELLNQTT